MAVPMTTTMLGEDPEHVQNLRREYTREANARYLAEEAKLERWVLRCALVLGMLVLVGGIALAVLY